MMHDPLCLDGLKDEERDHIIETVDPDKCTFCKLIDKARAESYKSGWLDGYDDGFDDGFPLGKNYGEVS